MPEQLAFDEILRDGAAVQNHEGSIRPWALKVERPCDHFLARATLAGDQHACRRVRDPLYELAESLHRGALADELSLGPARLHLCPKRFVFGDDRALLERFFERGEKLVILEGLLDVIVSPLAHRLDRLFGRPVGRDHQSLGVSRPRPNGVEHLHTAPVGHCQVGDDCIVWVRASELIACCVHTIDDVDLVALAAQENLQHLAKAGFVVTNKNAR